MKKIAMKKTTKTLIIAIAAVVVLVGIFLLIKFIPSQQEETDTDFVEEIVLVSHAPSEVKQIEVSNEYGEYTLLSETPTVESTVSDGTTSEISDATVYTLVNYEDMELLTGQPDELASEVSSVTPSKMVNDGSNKKDFGLDNPRATVKTTFTNGEVSTIYLGNDAADDLGSYIMVDGKDGIYLVSSDSVDSYLRGAMDMISTEIGSSAATEEDAVFTKMVFGGTLFGGDVVLEYSDSPAYSQSYMITSPDTTIANEETVTYMVNSVRNLTADKVAAVNADDAKLKEYGLDNPYVTVEAEYPDMKVSYKTSEPDNEGNFYLENNGIVYQLNTSAVPWMTYTYEQMLPTEVLSPKLTGVQKITVKNGDKSYEFDVSNETQVTNVNDTDVEATVTVVKYNGKTLDEGNFNIFYQNLISAKRSNESSNPSDKKEVLKVSYEFTDGTTADAVYYEAENRKCPVLINGTVEATAYESYVNSIIADVAKVAAGEQVTSIS